MVRTIDGAGAPVKSTKATWDNHVQLAQYLQVQGLTAVETVPFLKSHNYTFNNLKYEATRVSAVIAGIEVCQTAYIPTLQQAIAIVAKALEDGTVKYTKAKGVHILPTSITSEA